MIYLMPNLNSEEFKEAYTIKNNDLSFSIYVGNVVRSIIALHDLINNKLEIKDKENKSKAKLEEKKEEKTEAKAETEKAKV